MIKKLDILVGWICGRDVVSSNAAVTFYMMEFALVAAAVGLASTLFGFNALIWAGGSKGAFGSAIAVAAIAWVLALESLG